MLYFSVDAGKKFKQNNLNAGLATCAPFLLMLLLPTGLPSWTITRTVSSELHGFYRPTLCYCGICSCRVSVRPSVRRSHAVVVSKRLNVAARKHRHTKAHVL